ncbi:MAG: zinc ribbon domain-containing protein [Pseudomonadota bacterium]|nr:zinc ribbon domain-containing protein [Pseudomonadota bacterium]
MPIYEYRCTGCGYEMDKLQKISDAPLTDCPACGRPALQKLVSAAGFRLKGGGWYETDFKSGKKKNVAKPDSGSKAGDAKPNAGKKTDAGSKSLSGKAKKTG